MIKKLNKITYTIIFTILTELLVILKFEKCNIFINENMNSINKFAFELYSSIRTYDFMYVTILIFIIYFYYNNIFKYKNSLKENIMIVSLSQILSIIFMVGNCYKFDNSLSVMFINSVQIFKSILFYLGYSSLFYYLIKSIYNNNIIYYKDKNIKKKTKNIVFISFFIIFLSWLPIIIISYPGLSTGDTFDEIAQFFHRESSWTIDTINLLSDKVYVNKHHSPLHTIILGTMLKIGNTIYNYPLGVFMYTIMQVLFALFTFTNIIKYLNKINISKTILIFSILFLSFNPLVVTYMITAIKDTPSALFNIIYVIYLLKIVNNYDNIIKNNKHIFLFIFVVFMMLALRNNCLYTYILSFPLLFFLKNKKNNKKLFAIFILPLILFYSYNNILLPSLNVSDGSRREALSIPFMQLARTIKYKEDEFTNKDIEKINKVLDFDKMASYYDPMISDEVKELYNKDCTKTDRYNFMKVWFKYLKKYPGIYIESFINSTYAYFYPGVNKDILHLYPFKSYKDNYWEFKEYKIFTSYRNLYNKLINIYFRLPVLFNTVSIYNWILLLSMGYIIIKKQYKYLICISPFLITLLACLASPLNGSFRYILPIIIGLPIIISIDYLVYKSTK